MLNRPRSAPRFQRDELRAIINLPREAHKKMPNA